ncbi:MAG: aminopeptidase P family protein [Geobacter sp.]|nr:MAG: aminopeptidase P family protein [Geobacter sp.]
MLNNRFSSARRHLERFGVDTILFLGLPNIRYLTGFTGSDGVLVLGAEEGWFLTDSRYTTQASMEVSGARVIEYRSKTEGIAALLNAETVKKAGFEAEHTTVSYLKALAEALPGVELLPIGAELDDLRIIKSVDELQLLARCAEIASEALIGVLATINAGASEREVALALEFAMRRAGADDKSFDFIVASGSRGALPHGKASDKIIQSGELVTIDFGAIYEGYHSDETVTVAVGTPDNRQKEIYSTVKEAHDMAMEAVRPGISLKELDDVARRFIEERGYGAYFGHGLGHGVGLEVHEKPTVSFRSDQRAEEGMVFTIEPGIYIPGWGGVRIEDTVVVTMDGCRPLSKVPKQLMIL